MIAKSLTPALILLFILLFFTSSSWARPYGSPQHSVNMSKCQNIEGQEFLKFEVYASIWASVGKDIEQVQTSAFPHSYIHVESVNTEPSGNTPQYEVTFKRADGSFGRTTVTCEQTTVVFYSHYDG